MAISSANYLPNSASGLDTTSIVNQLVQIESQPITTLQTQQTALKAQVSKLGVLSSQVSALADAAKLLSSGVVQVGVTSTNTGFSAAADSSAAAGNTRIQVTALAEAAKSRSQGLASAATPVAGGSFQLDVRGTSYTLAITDGTSLADVVAQLNALGAPIQAAVISDGTLSYLSVSNRESGFPSGVLAADALKFTWTAGGASANATLAFSSVQTAANAALTVDDLPVTSTSNDISNVIPGVTLSLKALTAAPETLTLGNDQAATAKNLQAFVSSYNILMSNVHSQLAVSAESDRSSTLSGDPTVRSLQQRLQSLFSSVTTSSASIRSLADLGLTTNQRDGSLTLDVAKLNAALALDTTAVNSIFSQATTGVAAQTQSLVTQYTDFLSGAFTLRQQGLNGQVKSIDTQVLRLQDRLAVYRTNLIAQFTAMEKIVSGFKAASTYLTNLTNQLNAGNN